MLTKGSTAPRSASRPRANSCRSWRCGRQGKASSRKRAKRLRASVLRQRLDLLHDGEETVEEKNEQVAIAATRQAIVAQRESEARRRRESLKRVDATLAALPPPFDASQIERSQRGAEDAQRALAAIEAAYLKALHDHQASEELRRRKTVVEERLAAFDASKQECGRCSRSA
jgi:hypothetical protein